jgi:hypothetical protein
MKKILSISALFAGLLVSQAQTSILNGDFENWETGNSPSPEAWFGLNVDTFFVFGPDTTWLNVQTLHQTTDAQSGNSAVLLKHDTTSADGEEGVMLVYTGDQDVNFNIGDDLTFEQQETGGVLNNIKGYYKFIPDGVDTAFLGLGYTSTANGTGDPDYLYMDTLIAEVNTYTEFTLEAPTGISVDSFQLAFLGGKNQFTELYIDNITVEENIGIIEHEKNDFSVYQNVYNGDIRIETESVVSGQEIRLINMEGKPVARYTMDASEKLIDVSGFSRGNYLIQIVGGNKFSSVQKITIR